MNDRAPAHLSLTLSRRSLLAAIAAFSATPAWAVCQLKLSSASPTTDRDSGKYTITLPCRSFSD
jgi:hypothetical protein